MSSQTAATGAVPTSPDSSSTPLVLSEQQQQVDSTAAGGAEESKGSKRRFFGLGKKKEAPSQSKTAINGTTQALSADMSSSLSQSNPSDLKVQDPTAPISISPLRTPHRSAGIVASSPSRLRSSSPRLHSPASSEIFERNVQEPIPISALSGELSPAHIPAHVMTEDHIPPALEASAQAITSEELNPDDVEIVMSASHQPAAATVLEAPTTGAADPSSLHSPLTHQKSDDSVLAPSLHQSSILSGIAGGGGTGNAGGGGADEDGASNYGQLDPTDVRRLSFISFKDIVQSEHQHLAAAATAATSSSGGGPDVGGSTGASGPDRTGSPLRSPRSPTSVHSPSSLATSGGVTTPPLLPLLPPGVQIDTAFQHTVVHPDQSPVRSLGLGSPASQHGELTIETMRQALRKTASGDLSIGRGAGMSPVGDEGFKDFPRRTNT